MVQDSLFQNQKTTVHTNPCCLQCSPNQHTVPALQLAVALTTWCIQAHLWWQCFWSLSLHGDVCRRVSRHQAVDFEKISCTDLSPIIPLPQTTKKSGGPFTWSVFFFFKQNENIVKSLKVPKPNTKEPYMSLQVYVVMQQILPTVQELVAKWKTETSVVEVCSFSLQKIQSFAAFSLMWLYIICIWT